MSSNLFTDQQLVEDVLFSTNCIESINVTNTVSGGFDDGDLSYGFFEANNSSFPFSNGIVLSTGRLSNVAGPNNNLSDDDAPNWNGDQDLEDILNINNTTNASIFEFSFVPQASSISFRYIFASEEYRENNSSTCNFSDAFAFLIRPEGGQFENLALIPGTDIPVQVTTVRPEIPGSCEALNEEFFGQFNTADAPINFNGQTAILTAETTVIPGQTYEIKLVIADETNFRFDSAVFIEGNSFNAGVNLGQDQNLCQEETLNLQIENQNATDIRWFYEDQLINDSENNITISETNFGSGLYRVEVGLPSGCIAVDEVQINYNDVNISQNLSLSTCTNATGIGVYNLFDINTDIDNSLQILNFYNSKIDAELEKNPIQNPNNFQNNSANQNIFFKVINASNCSGVGQLTLNANTEIFDAIRLRVCSEEEKDISIFESQFINNKIAEALNIPFQNVDFYSSSADAINQNNQITSEVIEVQNTLLPLTVYGRINDQSNCLGLIPIVLDYIDSLNFQNNQSEFLICNQTDPEILLSASLNDPKGDILYEWSTGETTENIVVSSAGNYSVEVTSTQSIDNDEITCVKSKNFIVEVSSLPDISISQTGFSGNGQVIITAQGEGNYVFALNDNNFTLHNKFDITKANNTIYVRDKNGCGTVSLDFIALDIPDFFTPNGDGFNDYWQIRGIRQIENDIKSIYIFDRYGKLLKKLSTRLIGWDGTFKEINMPAQDYWYKIQMHSGQVLSGHFSLLR